MGAVRIASLDSYNLEICSCNDRSALTMRTNSEPSAMFYPTSTYHNIMPVGEMKQIALTDNPVNKGEERRGRLSVGNPAQKREKKILNAAITHLIETPFKPSFLGSSPLHQENTSKLRVDSNSPASQSELDCSPQVHSSPSRCA